VTKENFCFVFTFLSNNLIILKVSVIIRVVEQSTQRLLHNFERQRLA